MWLLSVEWYVILNFLSTVGTSNDNLLKEILRNQRQILEQLKEQSEKNEELQKQKIVVPTEIRVSKVSDLIQSATRLVKIKHGYVLRLKLLNGLLINKR